MKSSSQKIFSLSVIKTALMLLLITGITVALLAAVNFVTSPVIAENEKAETSKLIKTMFGDAEFDEAPQGELGGIRLCERIRSLRRAVRGALCE